MRGLSLSKGILISLKFKHSMNKLPPLFIQRLQQIIPAQFIPSVFETFTKNKILSVRLNTLRDRRENILSLLKDRGVEFKEIPWYPDALIVGNLTREQLGSLDFIGEGYVYRQSLSSMLAALVLNPCPGERILDLCSAPGSKTTQMASMMRNEGEIVCVEAVKNRFYKLKSVISLLGAGNVKVKLLDGRKFKDKELFDKILVDAPCSCEGLFHGSFPESFAYWSLRKVKEMVQKQRGLLLNAARLLKESGTLVYSTCTFAPEENEGVIDWLLRKSKVKLRVVPVEWPKVATYPAIMSWHGKTMNNAVQNCARILPTDLMDGFFIAKMERFH